MGERNACAGPETLGTGLVKPLQVGFRSARTARKVPSIRKFSFWASRRRTIVSFSSSFISRASRASNSSFRNSATSPRSSSCVGSRCRCSIQVSVSHCTSP